MESSKTDAVLMDLTLGEIIELARQQLENELLYSDEEVL
jgi:hypothetical protein